MSCHSEKSGTHVFFDEESNGLVKTKIKTGVCPFLGLFALWRAEKGQKRAKLSKLVFFFGKPIKFPKNEVSCIFLLESVIFQNFQSQKRHFLTKSRFRLTCPCANSVQMAPKNLKKFRGPRVVLGNLFPKFGPPRSTWTPPYIYIYIYIYMRKSQKNVLLDAPKSWKNFFWGTLLETIFFPSYDHLND